jgi:hypothetical protein
MRLTVYLSDNGILDVADFDAASVLDLREELNTSGAFLTFEMDGATVLVARDHIVRIDVEEVA